MLAVIQTLKIISTVGQAALPLSSVEIMGLISLLGVMIQNSLFERISRKHGESGDDAQNNQPK